MYVRTIDERLPMRILDNVPVPITYLDRDLIYRYCNAEAAQHLGRPVEEIVGQNLHEVVPDNPTIWNAVQGVLDTGEPFEQVIHFVWSDRPELGERYYRVSYRPDRDQAGRIIGVYSEGEEITDQHRAEEALRRTNEEMEAHIQERTVELDQVNLERERLLEASQRRLAELDATISSIAEGVILYDAEGRIVRLNQTAQEIVDLSPEEIGLPINQRVKHLHARLGEDQRADRAEEMPTTRAMHGETVRNQLVVLQRNSDPPHWLLVNAAPIQMPSGQTLGVISSFSDVTALHDVQQQLQEANGALEERAEVLQQQAEEMEVQEEELRCQADELLQQNQHLEQVTRDLEAERANLATILAHAPDAILVSDPDGRVVRMNPVAQALYGWPAEGEPVPGARIQRYHPDRTPMEREELPIVRAACYGETHQGVEIAVRSADGQWHDLLVNAVPLRDGQGHITGAVAVQRDITERKRAEEAMRASRARLQAAMNSMTDAVFISDVEGRFIDFNDAFATFHRFKSKAECATTLAEYPDFLDVYMADGTLAPLDMWAVPRALRGETGTNIEYTLRRKDTGETWIGSYSFAPIHDEHGAIIGSVVVGRDITEIRRAQQERERLLAEAEEARQLSESLNRIDALLAGTQNIGEVITQVLVEAAQALRAEAGALLRRESGSWVIEHVFGVSQQIVGQRLSDEQADVSAYTAQSREVLFIPDLETDHRFTAPMLRGLGMRSVLVIPLFLQGQATGVMILGRQLGSLAWGTAQVDMAAKLAVSVSLAQENARLYEQARHDASTRAVLLREVNHRVKNNLAAIIGMLYAEEERPEVKDQPAFRAVLEDMVRRTGALAVAHGMLSAAQWAPLPLDEMARQIADNQLRMLPPGQLEVQVAPSTVRISSDQAHPLALILNELVQNAAKYALDGRETRQMTVAATAREGQVVLVLRDNGPGYPEEVLAQRHSGIGLGLVGNLVRRNLRGQFSLRNEGGAVAEISFPLKEMEQEGENGKE